MLGGALKESDFWPQWEAIVSEMREAGAPDQPFRQFIEEMYGAEERQEVKRLALDYVEGFNAASADRISVARRADGVERIVEIGDGQVSDLVGWSVERFVEI